VAWAAVNANAVRLADVHAIALNCSNTNVTLPYIDIANEILESAIAPPTTAVTFINTLGTSDERRAIPQQISNAAYDLTANAVFPLNLPFDLPFAQSSAYTAALGAPRGSILALFAGNPPSAAAAANVAGAFTKKGSRRRSQQPAKITQRRKHHAPFLGLAAWSPREAASPGAGRRRALIQALRSVSAIPRCLLPRWITAGPSPVEISVSLWKFVSCDTQNTRESRRKWIPPLVKSILYFCCW
jgi:hypothetical protein